MRRRILSLLLCLALVCTLLFSVSAADFTDTQGHWAQEVIEDAVRRNLFVGTSEVTFSPDMIMDRAMFVTVLGRLAGVDVEQWQCDYLELLYSDTDANAYYAPYVAWAAHMGITSGTGDGKFSPHLEVTREQMACMILNYLKSGGYTLSAPAGEVTQEFTDAADVSLWAASSVDSLKDSGIFAGIPDGSGGYCFLPQKGASRAECAVVFCKLQDSMVKAEDWEPVLPAGIVLYQDELMLEVGESALLQASVFPFDATNQHIIWYSSDRNVVTVDNSGQLLAVGPGDAFVYAVTCNGLSAYCQVSCSAPALYIPTTYAEKCMLIFGQVVDDPRTVYADSTEALAHMTTITVRTWDISNGEKYTRTWALTVHENAAPLVAAIFEEIYALPEKPPIHSLGGYRWDGKCEHSPGLAIDINPNENYYCSPNGTAIVGSYFKPDEDPYSIPVDGAIDRIFQKYGFKRGIYWNSGYKDYMHYSYFGT